MEKVTGVVCFQVYVICPHCKKVIDIMDMENRVYDSNFFIKLILGTSITPSNWRNIGLDIECHKCKKEFELKNAEYTGISGLLDLELLAKAMNG